MSEQQKTAFITGGAKGIGLETAKAFINDGVRACIIDIDETEGQKIQAELGKNLLYIKADVAKSAEVQKAVTQCLLSFGRIDYLVNNVGLATASSYEIKEDILSIMKY